MVDSESLDYGARRTNNEETKVLTIKKRKAMKKEGWKTLLQILASIITAILTTLGTTSCMGV